MKTKEVLNVLQITKPTLTKYVKNGNIKVTVMGNGRYDYDADSVYKMLNKETERKTYLYARVTAPEQKKSLKSQIELLKIFCIKNGYPIHGIYQDVASGISFDEREQFSLLLNEVLAGRVRRVIIMYKDRITRMGFDFFSTIFEKYGCEIVVINEMGSEELDCLEIAKEFNHLLDCYSVNAKKKFLNSIKKSDKEQTGGEDMSKDGEIKNILIDLADKHEISYGSEVQAVNKGFAYAVGNIGANERIVKQALGARVVSRVQFGKSLDTALDIAITQDDLHPLEILTEGNSEETYYNARSIALRMAAEKGCLWIVDYLVTHGADILQNHDALTRAVESGKKDVVKYLVSHGADVNIRWGEKDMMVHYVMYRDMEMLQFLTEHGFDVCKGLKRQYNIITAAVKTKDLEIVEYLLDSARESKRKAFLKNMMVYAANQRNADVLKYLIERPEFDCALLLRVQNSIDLDGRLFLSNCKLSKYKYVEREEEEYDLA